MNILRQMSIIMQDLTISNRDIISIEFELESRAIYACKNYIILFSKDYSPVVLAKFSEEMHVDDMFLKDSILYITLSTGEKLALDLTDISVNEKLNTVPDTFTVRKDIVDIIYKYLINKYCTDFLGKVDKEGISMAFIDLLSLGYDLYSVKCKFPYKPIPGVYTPILMDVFTPSPNLKDNSLDVLSFLSNNKFNILDDAGDTLINFTREMIVLCNSAHPTEYLFKLRNINTDSLNKKLLITGILLGVCDSSTVTLLLKKCDWFKHYAEIAVDLDLFYNIISKEEIKELIKK